MATLLLGHTMLHSFYQTQLGKISHFVIGTFLVQVAIENPWTRISRERFTAFLERPFSLSKALAIPANKHIEKSFLKILLAKSHQYPELHILIILE